MIQSNTMKRINYGILFLLMTVLLVLAGCTIQSANLSSSDVTEGASEISLEGLVLTNGTIFITKANASKQLTHQLMSIQMPANSNPLNPGSLVKFMIKNEIRESYPLQATGVSATVLAYTSPAIKAPLNTGPAIINHMPADAYFIDVRTPEEFVAGRIEGAINLPLDDLETLIAKEVPDKNKVILLYCRSGNRSATAAQLLKDLNYTIVFDLGGINDYQGDLVTGTP